PILTDHAHDSQLMCLIILEKAVGHSKIFPNGNPEDLRRFSGLLGAQLGCATCAELAPGQVQDPDLFTCSDVPGDRAAASQFSIIGMRGDDEYVEFHGRL